MHSWPAEDDEDWGARGGSDSDGSDGGGELRQAGGPLRCWQRAGVKRLRIDDSRPATVRLPRYELAPCCAVCGHRQEAGRPLASLFDNTGFVSIAEVMTDVLGVVFCVSDNRNENLLCAGCRGHLLALHTMRAWLCALQKRYVRMVVRTNAGRRSAKVLVPKRYKEVDFFRLEKPPLELTSRRAGDGQTPPADARPDSGAVAAPGAEERVPDRLDPEVTVPAADDQYRGTPGPGFMEPSSGGPASAPVPAAVAPGGGVGNGSDGPAPPSGYDAPGLGPALFGGPDPTVADDREATAAAAAAEDHNPIADADDRPATGGGGGVDSAPAAGGTDAPVGFCDSQPPRLPAAADAPPAPPGPDPEAATPEPGGDPFEEYSISDLLVLRSPIAAKPATPEKPASQKLVRIAPKVDRWEAGASQASQPIVLNIMPISLPVAGASSPSFKAIVPRRPRGEADRVPVPPPPPAPPPPPPLTPAGRGRRTPRRPAGAARDNRKLRRLDEAGGAGASPPPAEPAAFAEPMVFYNPDGSIPAPPYGAQFAAAGAGAAPEADSAGEYASLQALQLEPLSGAGYREHAALEMPGDVHAEIARYAAEYDRAVYEEAAPSQQPQPQQQQPQLQPQPQQPPQQQPPALPPPPALQLAAGSAGSSSRAAHQVAGDGKSGDKGDIHQMVAPMCKLCGEGLSSDVQVVGKHFVSSHMALERDQLTGRIVYRCHGCKNQSTSLEMLKKHFGTRHVNRSVFACSKCGQRFGKMEALQFHVRRHHLSRTMCSSCGQGFLTARALAVHVSKAHPSDRRPGPVRPGRPS